MKDDDLVLLGKFDLLKANMIEPILKDNQIPYQRKAKLGSGFTLQAGSLMEEISFYILFEQYDKVMELIFPFLLPQEAEEEQ